MYMYWYWDACEKQCTSALSGTFIQRVTALLGDYKPGLGKE